MELRELYRRSLAVAVAIEPNTDYAAGVNGMLEGMSMAKPVFVTGTSGLADYLDPECLAGIAHPGDIGSLTCALERLGDTALMSSRSAAAREKVIREYTLESYVGRISNELEIATA
ncbi:hypothetical protein Acsp06_46090 [Actinomycetospora sp. NBRC 106375]|nr:hypothetical protein Acsp06_46090 [Actinomycetospora sp. NBRC 106375]